MQSKEDDITEPNTLRNRFNKCRNCGAPFNAGETFAAHSEGHSSGPSQRDDEGGSGSRVLILPGVDDTLVLLAVLLNCNYCCRFSNGSVDYYGTHMAQYIFSFMDCSSTASTKERDLCEGPVPRLDTCLFMLFPITTLVIANIIVEEECELIHESEHNPPIKG
uniref:C2H2-type domain-containing protein n=1 Tax=Quercus lobata TaxID=97700 RepID=A0A7N2MLL9_QUELO